MKKLYTLISALWFITSVNAQIVNIPDANFKARLLAASPDNEIAKDLSGAYFNIDDNYDGEIEVSEVLSVSYLNACCSSISDMTGIQSFSNLKRLYCSYNKLTSLNLSGLTQLSDLVCTNIQLTSLNLSGLTQLGSLNCNDSALTNLNLSGLTQLSSLKCNNNQLTNLDLSGLTQLSSVECMDNQLTNLDLSGTQLVWLYCNTNQLTNLDLSGLTKLSELYCAGNKLTTLDLSGLTQLSELNCENNQLTDLDLSGLTQLVWLSCHTNKLTYLDLSGSTKLSQFYCNDNLLTNLNLSGLTQLYDLQCDNNQLTNLGLSGLTQLSQLNCNMNKLTDLDLSGLTKLGSLNCDDNQIVNLDFSGLTEITQIFCRYNQLTNLNLQGLTNLATLYCSDNENLTSIFMKDVKVETCDQYGYGCGRLSISNCPKLSYICGNEKNIASVQNQLDYFGYTNCEVNSYCSFNPGGTYYTIQGATKLDINSNNCDENDTFYPNLKFSITDGITSGGFISNATGNYSIPVQEGTHTVTPIIENPIYFNVSSANFQVTFPTETSPYTNNFCITPNGEHNDLEVTVIPLQPAVPGFDAKYKVVYKNKGNMVQSGSISLSFDDAVLDFVSAIPVTSTQTVGNLSWDFTNLTPFETRETVFTLNVNTPEETPAVKNDDILHYIATVTSADTDETPVDNSFTLNQTVVGPFDPNDKTCLEGSVITPSLIGQYVHYKIRFENKGTYPAQNIVVKDMIDLSKFDISTLVPIDASHSFVTRITNGNKVEFIFENINLPFDDANNDGYIAFKIKTLPTLVVGNSFENEANIYFDYNSPILTNKATATFRALSVQDFEFSNYFSLYPNPVNDVLKLSTKATIEVNSISVYNTLGQMVIAIPNAETVSAIDVTNLTSGTYFVRVNTNRGTSDAKFIKN